MPRYAEPVPAASAKKAAPPAAVRPQPQRKGTRRGAAWHAIQLEAARNAAAAGPAPASPSRLPAALQAGVERLSGFAMADVRVHRNSPEPARLGALAYTRGADIHLAPGQDRHLPHEAWHVVQQKQGRVRATTQLKDVKLNDDAALEREADAMAARVVAPRLRTDGAARVSGGASAAGAHAVTQCKTTLDNGGKLAKTYYAAEIAATATEKIIDSFSYSMNDKSGVYITDEKGWLGEFHTGEGSEDAIRVVLPDLDHFKKNPDDLFDLQKANGLSAEQNCRLVAEHELTHLRQASQNAKTKGAPKGGDTASDYFSDRNIEKTLDGILGEMQTAEYKLGQKLPKLAAKADYIRARIEYVRSVWKTRNKNHEGPAVMRELRRYLEAEPIPDSFKAAYATIKMLDEDCAKNMGIEPPKKGFWSWFS